MTPTFLSGVALGIAAGIVLSVVSVVVRQRYGPSIQPLLSLFARGLKRPGYWFLGLLVHAFYYPRYRDSLVKQLSQVAIPGQAEKVGLNHIYVPPQLHEHRPKQYAVDDDNIPVADAEHHDPAGGRFDWFQVLREWPRLVILGPPGIGKSTFLKHVALNFAWTSKTPANGTDIVLPTLISRESIRRLSFERQDRYLDYLIPIFVSLPEYSASDQDLTSLLATTLRRKGIPLANRFLKKSLVDGQCLLLVDGLDSVSPDNRAQVVTELNQISSQFPYNHIIVSALPVEYDYGLVGFDYFELRGFAEGEVYTFINHWFENNPVQATGLLSAFERSQSLRDLGSIPLVLSTIVARYEQDRPASPSITDLYYDCCRDLLRQGTTLAHPNPSAQFDWRLRLQVLQEIAYRFYKERKTRFSEAELLDSVTSVLSEKGWSDEAGRSFLAEVVGQTRFLYSIDGSHYQFIHRSFQAYLTARQAHEEGTVDYVVGQADDPWWQEVVVFCAGLQRDATDLVVKLRSQLKDRDVALLLASRCAAEGYCQAAVRQDLRDALLAAFEEDGVERYRETAYAVAGLDRAVVQDAFTGLLDHQDAKYRRMAAIACGRLKADWAAKRLVTHLKRDEDWQVRATAAWALGEMAKGGSVPALVAALNDNRDEVKEEAEKALIRIGKPSIRVLATRVQDPEAGDRCARALGKIGKPALLPLEDLIRNSKTEEERAMAVTALGWIMERRALEMILQVLSEERDRVRNAALEALQRFIDTLGSNIHDAVPRFADTDLSKIEIGDLLSAVIQELAQQVGFDIVLMCLRSLKGDELEIVIKQGELPPEDRSHVLQTMQERCNQIAKKAQRSEVWAAVRGTATYGATGILRISHMGVPIGHGGDCIGVMMLINLGSASYDEDQAARAADILRANGNLVQSANLHRLLSHHAIRPLITILTDQDLDERTGDLVSELLQRFGRPAAREMIDRLEASRDDQNIARLLEMFNNKWGVEHLKAFANSPDQAADRRGALRTLRLLAERQPPNRDFAVPALLDLLHSQNNETCTAAIQALGRIRDPRAVAPLIAVVEEQERDIPGRTQAIWALERIPGPKAIEALKKIVNDENEPLPMRARAAEALGKHAEQVDDVDDALIAALDSAKETELRRALARVLAQRRTDKALSALVGRLTDEDRQLREIASKAILAWGKKAVEPLITAIYDTKLDHRRNSLLRQLEELGRDIEVAAEWHRLLISSETLVSSEFPELADMFSMAKKISLRSKLGDELYCSLRTASRFLEYRLPADFARAEQAVAWLDEMQVRPDRVDVLRRFSRVASKISGLAWIEGTNEKKDALLSITSEIRDLRAAVGEQLIGPDRFLCNKVIERWDRLITGQIKGLGGRARLLITPKTERLHIRDRATATPLLFDLMNTGETAAQNVSISLAAVHENEMNVIGDVTKHIRYLGPSASAEIGFIVKPLSEGRKDLTLEVRYDDAELTEEVIQSSATIEFYRRRYRPRAVAGWSESVKPNPYIVGKPVKNRDMFFGREEIIDWARDNYSSTGQQNALVLYGQRRTGKTSVLYQLPLQVTSSRHVFVFFDAQGYSDMDTQGFYYYLAERIAKELARNGVSLPTPTRAEYTRGSQARFRAFCEDLEGILEDRSVVLMFDEFDHVVRKVNEGTIEPATLDFIRSLMQHSAKLSFVFAGTHYLNALLKQRDSILFNATRPFKLTSLERQAARDLITQPAEETMNYNSAAVERILQLTGRQPCYIQYACHSLFEMARREGINRLELQDVLEAVPDILDQAAGDLAYLFDSELSLPERVALAGLAEVSPEPGRCVSRRRILDFLKGQGFTGLNERELSEALSLLEERELVECRREGQSLRYRFRLDLLRMWVREKQKLLKLRPEVEW